MINTIERRARLEAISPKKTLIIVKERGLSGAASAGATYIHTQASPSSEWIINHNLGFRPDVTVLDTGGQVVGVLVLHISENQARVYAEPALAGVARCE
jgi:hypothetical protein